MISRLDLLPSKVLNAFLSPSSSPSPPSWNLLTVFNFFDIFYILLLFLLVRQRILKRKKIEYHGEHHSYAAIHKNYLVKGFAP